MPSFFSTKGFTDEFGDPDLIYYNADIVNQKSTNSQNWSDIPVAKFQEIRNVPIINNPSNFEFTIVRCDMNGVGKDLPLMIPNVVLDGVNTDPNKLVYTIGIYMAVNYTSLAPTADTAALAETYQRTNLTFIPENLFSPVPTSGNILKEQDLSTDYYYLTTYQKFLTFINTALKTLVNSATISLNNSINAGSPQYTQRITQPSPPKMIYDPSTQLFSIYVPSNISSAVDPNKYPATTSSLTAQVGGSGTNTLSPLVQIWMSQSLYDLFSSFQANNQGDTRVGESYQILYYDNFNNSASVGGCSCATPPVVGMDYKILSQEYPTTSTLWSPISSIVFCSSLIPIFNEYVSNPVVFDDKGNNIAPNTTSNSNFTPIITDISLATDTAQDYRGFVSYVPSAEYRMSSINGNQPLNALDIQIYWKNRLNGTLNPIKLSNYSTINLKILFRKRGYNGN